MTQNLRTIIAEDDRRWIKMISNVILEINNRSDGVRFDIIDACRSKDKAKKSIKLNEPNIVFLDIEMPNRGDAFDLIEELNEEGVPLNFIIVIITGHSSGTNFLRYLDINQRLGLGNFFWINKKYLKKDFIEVFNKLKVFLASEFEIENSNKIIAENLAKDLLDQEIIIGGPRSFIQIFKTAADVPINYREIRKMKVGDILYFEGGGFGDSARYEEIGSPPPRSNENRIHFINEKGVKETLLIRKKLSEIKECFGEEYFRECSRSVIVNRNKIVINSFDPQTNTIKIGVNSEDHEVINVTQKNISKFS